VRLAAFTTAVEHLCLADPFKLNLGECTHSHRQLFHRKVGIIALRIDGLYGSLIFCKGYLMPIQISVGGLAKFMKATSAAQRTLLRNHKFPFTAEGKKRPQIVRYSEARTAIRKYHESGNNITVLLDAIEVLVKKENEHPEKDSSRIRDNVRALKTYMAHFSKSNFTVLENPKPKYEHGEVIVSAAPDLFVDEEGKRKLIKLDFNALKPDAEVVQIILKVMHEASVVGSLGVQPRDVIYLDVSRQTQYTGAKLNKRLKRDIDAACETIADIWPRIKQSAS
jgi:hypothetical protein